MANVSAGFELPACKNTQEGPATFAALPNRLRQCSIARQEKEGSMHRSNIWEKLGVFVPAVFRTKKGPVKILMISITNATGQRYWWQR